MPHVSVSQSATFDILFSQIETFKDFLLQYLGSFLKFLRVVGNQATNTKFAMWAYAKGDASMIAKIGYGTETRLLDPFVLSGLLIGSMLPFLFSAMTMKSVGKAALEMVKEGKSTFCVLF